MSKIDKHSSGCGFEESLVEYLYNEINSSEISKFERHLKECASCEAEISDFGIVRSSIGEWRDSEFAAMISPEIALPESAESNVHTKSVGENGSWLSRLLGKIAITPQFASAAIAILAVVLGIGFALYSYSDSTEIADFDSETDVSRPVAEVKAAANTGTAENQVALGGTAEPDIAAAPIPETGKPDRVDPISVRRNEVALKKPRNRERRESTFSADKPDETTTANQNRRNNGMKQKEKLDQNMPKLTPFDEIEDESLRLADLFAEVDSK